MRSASLSMYQVLPVEECEKARAGYVRDGKEPPEAESHSFYLTAWEEDRERAWGRVTDWPCATRPLRAGDSCEELVFVPSPPAGPLTLRFMATTDFPLESEGCALTLAGTTAPTDDLAALFAPWSDPTPQQTIAPADYVAATPYWD